MLPPPPVKPWTAPAGKGEDSSDPADWSAQKRSHYEKFGFATIDCEEESVVDVTKKKKKH